MRTYMGVGLVIAITAIVTSNVVVAQTTIPPPVGPAQDSVERRPERRSQELSGKLFDPQPLGNPQTLTVEPADRPAVSVPAQTTGATTPPPAEVLTDTAAGKDPITVDPVVENRPAGAPLDREAESKGQEVRDKPTRRARVASDRNGRERPRLEGRQKPRRLATRMRRLSVGQNGLRSQRAARLGASVPRSFSATMDAARYRVGHALGCLVKLSCTSRQVAGAAVGAAAGGAAGGSGGAVAGGFAGAILASRGR
jgi:hypothetical protein